MSGKQIAIDYDLIEQPVATDILAPHIPTLNACFRAAWENWEKLGSIAPELRYVLTPRTRAGFVNDHICQEVKVRFAGATNARVEEVRGLVLLTLHDPSTEAPALIMRFKKLNRELLSSNIKTAQQIDFSRQLRLPGFPSVTRLTAGYKLDMFQSAIQDLWITCAVQDNVLWALEIQDEEAACMEIEIEQLLPNTGQEQAGPRVRPINVQKRIEETKLQ